MPEAYRDFTRRQERIACICLRTHSSLREGVLRNAIYGVGTIDDGRVHAIAFPGQSEIGSRPHREFTRSEVVPALQQDENACGHTVTWRRVEKT